MPLQVFGDEPAMATVGGRFAAQQATVRDYIPRDGGVDEATLDQVVEYGHVLIPGDLLLAIGVQQFVRGRQAGQVDVVHAAQLPQEPGQIASLGEPSQPRRIAQPDVHYSFRPGLTQQPEKLLRRFAGETNGVELQFSVTTC